MFGTFWRPKCICCQRESEWKVCIFFWMSDFRFEVDSKIKSRMQQSTKHLTGSTQSPHSDLFSCSGCYWFENSCTESWCIHALVQATETWAMWELASVQQHINEILGNQTQTTQSKQTRLWKGNHECGCFVHWTVNNWAVLCAAAATIVVVITFLCIPWVWEEDSSLPLVPS